MELTEEQKLVTGIADYFNIEVPDIISEYVTDSVTVQRMIYAIVTVRNTDRLKRLYNANKNTFYDAVQNYNSEAYMENDKLASQIKEANDLAVKVTQANIEIRDLFQNQPRLHMIRRRKHRRSLWSSTSLRLMKRKEPTNL